MTKLIYAACRVRKPPADPTRPDRAYELLHIGVADAPIEKQRVLRHRLFSKYSLVPDCIVLEEVAPGQDWSQRKVSWKDVFEQLYAFSGERDNIRSQRIAKTWEEIIFEAVAFIPGSMSPRPGASALLELTDDASPITAFFKRIAYDDLKITGISNPPGSPTTLGIAGGQEALARFVNDFVNGKNTALLPPAPGL